MTLLFQPNSNVSWVVHHFGPDWNTSTTIRGIVMKFHADIHDPKMMNPPDFSYSLTFPVAPPWGSHFFVFSEKHLNNYWKDIHDSQFSKVFISDSVKYLYTCYMDLYKSLPTLTVVVKNIYEGIAMKFGIHIHGPQRMKSNNFGDPWTFPELPRWVWHLGLNNYRLPWNLV